MQAPVNAHGGVQSAAALVETIAPARPSPVILLCDHAGKVVPDGVSLGIPTAELGRHIGWDIGAADVTRALARHLEATALLCHVSRLVIDPNRRALSATSIPAISDGTPVPGNERLDPEEVRRRVAAYFVPYHRAVALAIGRERRAGRVPVVIAVHSFTPRMAGFDRPWEIGVLWRGDDRLARPLLRALRARPDLCVGDNLPYSGFEDFGFTVEFHCQRTRLPHAMLEIRQDEIASRAAAEAWAARIAAVLRPLLADPALYRLYDAPPVDHPQGPRGWKHIVGSQPVPRGSGA